MVTYIGPDALKPLKPLLPPPSRKSTAQSLPGGGLSPSRTSTASLADEKTSWSHHLDIINALKGHPHNAASRSRVAESILGIVDSDSKERLMDFIGSRFGTIASTLENNAFKAFNCSPDDFNSTLTPFTLHILTDDLWPVLFHTIIPNICAMLYPLEELNASFRIRRLILTHFRDRVLLPLMSNFVVGDKREVLALRPILARVAFESNDGSLEALRLNHLIETLQSGGGRSVKKEKNSSSSNDEEVLNEQARFKATFHMTPPFRKLSVDPMKSSLLKQGNNSIPSMAGERKARATTMPSKSVHWDDETTVDV